ncbi:MAG: hypothetical protein JXK94_14500 [Deltaproteobacteria bacterium]|nr:hypothetical protein [Deltaproteobacteria bacterium]
MGDLIDLKKYRGKNGKLCENSFQHSPEQLLEQIARATERIAFAICSTDDSKAAMVLRGAWTDMENIFEMLLGEIPEDVLTLREKIDEKMALFLR